MLVFWSQQIGELKPSSTDIDELNVFPFLNSSEMLVGELPSYITKSDGVSTEFDKLAWWKSHQHELPNLSKACKTALLIQPSSAAVERVFSLLKNSFKENQARALEDYI